MKWALISDISFDLKEFSWNITTITGEAGETIYLYTPTTQIVNKPGGTIINIIDYNSDPYVVPVNLTLLSVDDTANIGDTGY